MITIFGWLEIRATYLDEDKHPEINESMIYKEIEKKISELRHNEVELVEKNYTCYVQFSVLENHRTEKTEEIIELFNEISKIATGSYGLLYCLDDEDELYNDEFKVCVSKKGKIDWVKDEYFSPCSKMIESDE